MQKFYQGLLGQALLWFHQLSSGVIQSYAELTRKCIDNFFINVKISKKKKKKKAEELFTILQGAKEPLKKYVERFNSVLVNIPNCSESVAISAFKMGVLQGLEFKKDLTTRLPFNLEEVMSTSRRYIKLEEEEAQFVATKDIRQDEKKNDKRFRRDKSNDWNMKRFSNSISQSREGPKFIKLLQSILGSLKQVDYVSPYPFNIPHSKLIKHLKGKDYIQWPKRMNAPPKNRDRSKFCDFHNDHKHSTAYYRPLK